MQHPSAQSSSVSSKNSAHKSNAMSARKIQESCLALFAASPVSKAFPPRDGGEDEISLPAQDKTILE